MSSVPFDHLCPGPRPAIPPVPPPAREPDPGLPHIRTHRHRSRRRRDALPAFEIVFTLACLGVVAGVVVILASRLDPAPTPAPALAEAKRPPKTASKSAQAASRKTGDGLMRSGGTGTDRQPARRAGRTRMTSVDFDAEIDVVLTFCRASRFAEAKQRARTAALRAADDPRCLGLRLLVLYLEQYPGLAEQAIDRMNETVEIDLGHPFGCAAFVERTGDTLLFRIQGGRIEFSVAEFKALDGVCFRRTRQFLEAGRRPANDLILGAFHFVHELDDTGGADPTGHRARADARTRWQAAAGAGDEKVANDARALLSLLDDPTAQAAR